MKLSTFLTIKAVVCFLFALEFFVIPVQGMAMFGINLDPGGVLMVQFLGAMFVGVGLICWLYRSASYKTLQNILLALFVADTIGFVFALLAQLSGLTSTLGWVIVAIWLLLAAGLGYFRFMHPSLKLVTA